MKILEINVFYYRFGGSESVMFNTTDILREEGHEVIHFSLKWDKNISSNQGLYFPESKETRKGTFKSLRNLTNYFYHREAAQKLDLLLANEKPDIAQIHLFWGQITPSVLPVLRKHNVSIVFTIHEYRMVCPNYTFRNGKGQICEKCQGNKFWKCITNKCCQNSYLLSSIMAAEMYFRNRFFFPPKYIDGIIYVSKFAKKKHEEYLPETITKENIVLYNLSDKIYSSANTPSGDHYFLYFGRLSYEKGIRTLINVMVLHPEWKLKIVGAGAEEAELKRIAVNNNSKNIEFLGFKEGQDLMNLIRNAYFIIVPSEWYENNPMTIIEGYSASTPVIGADIGGIPEIIEDNKTGFLFESGNEVALAAVMKKANELGETDYISMRREALRFANDHFNRKQYYPRLVDFFNKIIQNKRSSARK